MDSSPLHTPMTGYLAGVIRRDLLAVRRQLLAYPDEEALWVLPPSLPNSAGTLARHLAGNLRHFIGAVLGGTGYVRDREAEFSGTRCARADVLAEVDAAIAEVGPALERLTAEALAEPFPVRFGNVQVETGDFLVHLSTHLAYHLGQLDYHRRVVTEDRTAEGAMAITELRTARP